VRRVRRVHAVADGPISVVDLSVPADIGKVITRKEVENRPLYEILPTIGIHLGPASQVIRAGAMTEELSEVSGISESTPVLLCERLTLDVDGRPIVHATFTYRSDRFEFHIGLAEGPATTSWVPSGLAVTEG
jgi:GntR family transcriptional regulator